MSAFITVEKITTSLTPNEIYSKVNEVIDQNTSVKDIATDAQTIITKYDNIIPSAAAPTTNILADRNWVLDKIGENSLSVETKEFTSTEWTDVSETETGKQLTFESEGIPFLVFKRSEFDNTYTSITDTTFIYVYNSTTQKNSITLKTIFPYTGKVLLLIISSN